MNDTARIFNCSRCHSLTFICRYCDRGNIYCIQCAPLARKEAERRAVVRYQDSPPGRQKHAAQQQTYRERIKQKVTHKGSILAIIRDRLAIEVKKKNVPIQPLKSTTLPRIVCQICSSLCSPYLRLGFLHQPL